MQDFDKDKIFELLDFCTARMSTFNGYFFCSEMQVAYYLAWAVAHKMRYNILIWDREQCTGLSYKSFISNVDYIVHIYKTGSLNKVTDKDYRTYYGKIWKEKQGDTTEHPTEKPYNLIERFVLLSSNENDVVFDPFLGSGTTAEVCKKTKRKFVGCEINKKFYDIARERVLNIREEEVEALRYQQLRIF